MERYPSYKGLSGLANDFCKFFVQKIDNIRSKLDNFEVDSPLIPERKLEYTGSLLTEFQRVSPEKVKDIVLSFPNKSCASDPIPTDMVKDCTDNLLPAISKMVNSPLADGYFPDTWKETLVKPKLKKPNMDLIKKNYRPVSNLVFLSKVTEIIAAKQVCSHLSINNLFPEFQSAYRNFHSTETALLRTRNDILINMNKQHVTLLVFLDLN